MSEISIYQFSDCHYSPQNIEESDRCVGEVVSVAIQSKPDAFVLSGDSTDHRLEVHSTALRALATRIKQCAEIAPILLLQGTYSHEPPGTIEMFGLLSNSIAIANRICQIALTTESTWIYSEGAMFHRNELDLGFVKAVFTCIPTLNKASLASSFGASEAAEEMGIQIQRYLKGAGVINAYFNSRGIPTIGVSHGTVNGCITEHGVPMMGNDHEFTREALFDAECSAFMLGHIHKHQCWNKEERLIAYPGSIGRFHYGEIGDKGFLKWKIFPNGAEIDFHVTPSRNMMLFDYDGMPNMSELKLASTKCHGAYVRVRCQIDQEHTQLINREQILEIFKDAKEVKTEIRILAIQRSRCDGINTENSTSAKLERWCELTSINPEPLVERLQLLDVSSPIELANCIVCDIFNFEKQNKIIES